MVALTTGSHLCDLAACWILRRIRDLEFGAIFHDHAVDTLGAVEIGQDQIRAPALAHDLHVQQAEEADPESEAERTGGFRLEAQRRIVELSLSKPRAIPDSQHRRLDKGRRTPSAWEAGSHRDRARPAGSAR